MVLIEKWVKQFQMNHGASAMAAFIDCAKYLTFFSLMPAIEILPLFNKYTWYLLIKISHCLAVSPVYENIPIWSVIWFHVPGVWIFSNSCLNRLLIFIIRLATISLSSAFHTSKFFLSFKMDWAKRAPWSGGLEYFFRTIILYKTIITSLAITPSLLCLCCQLQYEEPQYVHHINPYF